MRRQPLIDVPTWTLPLLVFALTAPIVVALLTLGPFFGLIVASLVAAAVAVTAIRLATAPSRQRAGRSSRRLSRRPETRRHDPDHASRSGDDRVKEAAEAPPQRARDLVD
jgi:hypothetical protein